MIIPSLLFWFSLFFIIYTYFGYPFLIAFFARMSGKLGKYNSYFPSVTLMIPAYNEEAYIARKLENTLLLDYPREKLQILVVADGSSDNTVDIVKSYGEKSVDLIYVPERNGKMAAIARAMNFARGDIVVFSDANNMYEEKALCELVAPFSEPEVGASTGAKLIVEDGRDLSSAEGLYWKYESAIKKNETILSSCVGSVGEILAVRKDLFMIPKEKIINDDHYIILNLLQRGYRVVYVPTARSFEYVSKSAKDEVERRTRMNAGLYQTISMSKKILPKRPLLLWQIFSHKYFRAFVPFAFLAALILNVMIVLFGQDHKPSLLFLSYPYGLLFLFLQMFFYGMAVIGNLIRFKGILGKVFYLPTFLVNSNLATLAGLYSFITNKQSHIWTRVAR
jgi:biofilm PGA synthesis N-glycosyltransferase PgaC